MTKPEHFGGWGHVTRWSGRMKRSFLRRTRTGICQFCETGGTFHSKHYPFDCLVCGEPSGLWHCEQPSPWKRAR